MSQRFDRLASQEPVAYHRGQPSCDQCQRVLILETPPQIAPEHGGTVEQDDALHIGLQAGVEERSAADDQVRPRVSLSRGHSRCRGDELGLDLLEDGLEEFALVTEVVVERPACQPCGTDDLLRAAVGIPTLAEERPGGAELDETRKVEQ